jgi:hypothetical protein
MESSRGFTWWVCIAHSMLLVIYLYGCIYTFFLYFWDYSCQYCPLWMYPFVLVESGTLKICEGSPKCFWDSCMNLQKTFINWTQNWLKWNVSVLWVYSMIYKLWVFIKRVEIFVKFCYNRLFNNCQFFCKNSVPYCYKTTNKCVEEVVGFINVF